MIGPTISQRAYEVGPELFDEVTADDAEAARFFAAGDGDRMQFDLPGYGLRRLRAAGVGEARVDRPLHLFRGAELLLLPPFRPPQGGRLRPHDLGHLPLTGDEPGVHAWTLW